MGVRRSVSARTPWIVIHRGRMTLVSRRNHYPTSTTV